jgi:hypothetical protein
MNMRAMSQQDNFSHSAMVDREFELMAHTSR